MIYNYNNCDISRFFKKIKYLRNVKLSSNLFVNKEVNVVICIVIFIEVLFDEVRFRMYSCIMFFIGLDFIYINK